MKTLLAILIFCASLSAQTVTGSSLNITGTGIVNGLLSTGGLYSHTLWLGGNSPYLRISNDGFLGTTNYFEGWNPDKGWKLERKDSSYTLTIDNLYLRGGLYAHEFLIDETKASTGDLIITTSGKVDSTDRVLQNLPPYPKITYYFTTEDVEGHGLSPFWSGDIIECQRVDMTGATFNSAGDVDSTSAYLVKRLIYKVDSTNGLRVFYSLLSGAPVNVGYLKKGDVFVRIGNTSLTSGRTGSIGLYVNQPNSPYLQVVDSINSWSAWKSSDNIKLRLGRLDGVVDTNFGGALSGYGLYSDNAYLKGKIVLTNQGSINISGFNNDANYANDSLATVANSTANSANSLANSAYTYAGNAYTLASGKNTTYYGGSAPGSPVVGDFWVDTGGGVGNYLMKRWDGSNWIPVGVYMDASGVYTGTLTAGQINAVNINAVNITGGTIGGTTITGGTLQTNTSGKRVVIDNSNTIKMYGDNTHFTNIEAVYYEAGGFWYTGLNIGYGAQTLAIESQEVDISSGNLTLHGDYVATEPWVSSQGYITGINSSMVTSALGYTPYNSSNPSGYQTAAQVSSMLPTSIQASGSPMGTANLSSTFEDLSTGYWYIYTTAGWIRFN